MGSFFYLADLYFDYKGFNALSPKNEEEMKKKKKRKKRKKKRKEANFFQSLNGIVELYFIVRFLCLVLFVFAQNKRACSLTRGPWLGSCFDRSSSSATARRQSSSLLRLSVCHSQLLQNARRTIRWITGREEVAFLRSGFTRQTTHQPPLRWCVLRSIGKVTKRNEGNGLGIWVSVTF